MKSSSLSIFVRSIRTERARVLPLVNAVSLQILLAGCASLSSLVGSSPTPSAPTNLPSVATAPGPSEQAAKSASLTLTSPAANATQEATNAAQAEIAQLKIEILSLKEKMATLQRKFDVALKAQRSGIYDDVHLSPDAVARLKNPKKSQNVVPPLTSEGPLDRLENGSDDDLTRREKVLNPQSPQQLVERASLLLESREFGKVPQLLEDFQQRFPNNGWSSVAELTLAEAYVELKSPLQALTHIRTFYLQHPNDVQLIKAKWLEGKSQELLDAPQKAAQVYREIIALDPQSQLALKARTALEKISGGGTQ